MGEGGEDNLLKGKGLPSPAEISKKGEMKKKKVYYLLLEEEISGL